MKPFASFSSTSCDHGLVPYSSKNKRHGGCMGRILCCILCINSIHSRPHLEEDQIKEPPRACAESAATPGIVARLMGLEPVMFMESIVRSPVLKSFEPFRKPRSPDGSRYHRIIPTYQHVLEDQNFFILSFESMDLPRKSRSRSGKKKQGSGVESKKKGTRRGSLQGRDEENVGLISTVNGMNNTSISDQNSNTRQRERKKKVERDNNLAAIQPGTEGNSQNSSPNSVLDFIESAPSPSSEENISRLKTSKLRRTLSEELENCANAKETTLFINKGYGHITPRSKVHAKKWFETRELTEHEMIKSSWVRHEMSRINHHDHLQEIGKDLTSQVLDQLLLELIINFS